jgi:hypothetical protein
MERITSPSDNGLHITPQAVEIFRTMQQLECTCTSSDDKCAGCTAYAHLDEELRRALALKPWQWPTIIGPDETLAHPPGSGAAEWYPLGRRLYDRLAGWPDNDRLFYR